MTPFREFRTYGTPRVFLHRSDQYHEPLIHTVDSTEQAEKLAAELNATLNRLNPENRA